MTVDRIATTSPHASTMPLATRYVGLADWWGRHVWIEDSGRRRTLRHRGADPFITFAWGRAGPGARELARAILCDATGEAALAERACHRLAREVIANLPQVGFTLEREEILAWCNDSDTGMTANISVDRHRDRQVGT